MRTLMKMTIDVRFSSLNILKNTKDSLEVFIFFKNETNAAVVFKMNLTELGAMPKDFLINLFNDEDFIQVLSDLKNGVRTSNHLHLMNCNFSKDQYKEVYNKIYNQFKDDEDLKLLLEIG